MKSWLQDNNTEMYPTHNERKFFVAERSIRTKKNKIYRHMTLVSKSMYIDKLNEYNNTCHSTIKIKSVDAKSNTYIDFSVDKNCKGPIFNVSDRVKISRHKKIFANVYAPNWSEEIFVSKKVKRTIPWTYATKDSNGEEAPRTFCEKELQKTNQTEFRVGKAIKKKFDKLYEKATIVT